jgi:ribosomal protein L24E
MWLLFAAWAVLAQTPAHGSSLDVSTVSFGAPATIGQLDVGKMGDLRQVSWSPDGSQIYIQTSEGKPGEMATRDFLVDTKSGNVQKAPNQPRWATDYWAFKSDRYAPGLPTLVIDVTQNVETLKIGPGSAGGADRNPINGGGGSSVTNSPDNVMKAAESQKENVVALVLLGQSLGEWVNERPTPGTTFSWGPAGSGAIAFVDKDGRVYLFDRDKHKKNLPDVKDASFPAWTTDGTRLAFVQKVGRKKYALVAVPVAQR